mmetsp:Transcript_8497/g.13024  ORF Transcript_8497/g.13024 Transcript_8497/m.13024 type:complete len:359 (+) Transcript_8497:4454-5530(+)
MSSVGIFSSFFFKSFFFIIALALLVGVVDNVVFGFHQLSLHFVDDVDLKVCFLLGHAFFRRAIGGFVSSFASVAFIGRGVLFFFRNELALLPGDLEEDLVTEVSIMSGESIVLQYLVEQGLLLFLEQRLVVLGLSLEGSHVEHLLVVELLHLDFEVLSHGDLVRNSRNIEGGVLQVVHNLSQKLVFDHNLIGVDLGIFVTSQADILLALSLHVGHEVSQGIGVNNHGEALEHRVAIELLELLCLLVQGLENVGKVLLFGIVHVVLMVLGEGEDVISVLDGLLISNLTLDLISDMVGPNLSGARGVLFEILEVALLMELLPLLEEKVVVNHRDVVNGSLPLFSNLLSCLGHNIVLLTHQ